MFSLSSPWRFFLTAAALSGLLCGLVYVTAQQVLRQTANDPQIQLAEDLAAALGRGVGPTNVVPPGVVDPSKSLTTFASVFDANGVPLASSAQLNGQVLAPPIGTLQAAKTSGENRLTWQPRPDVRLAAVIVPYASSSASGFVLVARSLREIEVRESRMLQYALAAWLACVAVSILAALSLRKKA